MQADQTLILEKLKQPLPLSLNEQRDHLGWWTGQEITYRYHRAKISGALPRIALSAKVAKTDLAAGSLMQILSAKDAKYGFGRLIDLARAGPVAVAKHGRPVVVVLAIEEYDRLKALDASAARKPKQGPSGRYLATT